MHDTLLSSFLRSGKNHDVTQAWLLASITGPLEKRGPIAGIPMPYTSLAHAHRGIIIMCHAQVQSSYYFALAIKHILFSWFTSAPLSINNWAVSVWPFSQATWSGVCSPYKQLHVFSWLCYCTPANAANIQHY